VDIGKIKTFLENNVMLNIKQNTTKTYGEMVVYFFVFLISTSDVVEWSAYVSAFSSLKK
jgi:hypothetical protein